MREILLCEDELRENIEVCREYANECGNKDYLSRLDEIEKLDKLADQWAELLTSEVFKSAVGEWERVVGKVVYIND